MIKKGLLPLLLLMVTFQSIQAQQDAQFTQYMFNTMSVNPAYAGSRGQLSIAGLYRSQWAGLEGAPKTQTLTLNSPIRDSKVGYGLSIINDNLGDGTVQETNFDAVVSYTIDVSQVGKLSFGLKAGGNLLNLDFSDLQNFDNEIITGDNIENKFSPNFGVGVYYHSDKFYAGFSTPNILQTSHFDNSQTDANSVSFLSKDKVSYYLITGYVFDLNSNVKLKPALLMKAVGGAPLQVDVSASFLFSEKFSIGAA